MKTNYDPVDRAAAHHFAVSDLPGGPAGRPDAGGVGDQPQPERDEAAPSN